MVLPLVTGVRTVGLVVAEADRARAFDHPMVSAAAAVAASSVLRLETALLFDDVRSLATTEERQRLAREIHDGVAQELVMVGYGIDNALALLPNEPDQAASMLGSLRDEVTRVITELRLSLFELRSDVDPHGGLAAAIAEYARTMGAAGGMRVHLSLDEGGARLPAAVEGELLRIAQEAITNARKHARARNLWVSCEIDPPYVKLQVSDDGRGVSAENREDSFGMSIMAERAQRIRARLEVGPRKPSGTTVSAVLGARPRGGSLAAPKEA
jgi:signal transduction histidine kinase